MEDWIPRFASGVWVWVPWNAEHDEWEQFRSFFQDPVFKIGTKMGTVFASRCRATVLEGNPLKNDLETFQKRTGFGLRIFMRRVQGWQARRLRASHRQAVRRFPSPPAADESGRAAWPPEKRGTRWKRTRVCARPKPPPRDSGGQPGG